MIFAEKAREFLRRWIVNPLTEISLPDVADILLLAVMLYLIIRFVRDRKAGTILVGLLTLGIFYGLTYICNLHALYSVFRGLFDCYMVVICILFNEEIRELLDRIGSFVLRVLNPVRFSATARGKADSSTTALVGVLADTACDLSREKTGALIVIQRETKLGEYIKTGVEIDAIPSCELFGNLFFNRSPLHDGAVIIRNGRVAAAGCILPSSKSPDIPVELGTRHRAGIGISEQSDAVVIIVSEETGSISIANNGVLKRNYTSGTIKDDLFVLLGGKQDAKR